MKRSLLFLFIACCRITTAQTQEASKQAQYTPPVTYTADEDRKNMMDQLGIKALRPGYSGNESAPNHANYDESKANPYPALPDVLTLKNGKKVTTPDMWWKQRRPEIAQDFEQEVYGSIPADRKSVV